MKTYALYLFAAVFEIAGCFSFWAWYRMDKSVLWLLPGMASLALFAGALALVPGEAAGRTYAAYGVIYILMSMAWLWCVEGRMPDRWDVIGVAICLVGGAVIFFGPRSA